MRSRSIAVLPFGDISREDLGDLSKNLEKCLGFFITVLPTVMDPSDQVRPGIDNGTKGRAEPQFDVASFMNLTRNALEESDDKYLKILGVTGVDLYTPGMNFIFGQAEINGKICVISTARLKYNTYWIFGRRRPEAREMFILRMTKEAVHELGHTFGLHHCSDTNCVMHFSNTLEDTDLKSDQYCRGCKRKLKRDFHGQI